MMLELTPSIVLVLVFAFLAISYFMGMLVHSAWMYEDKGNMKKDSRQAWVLCMAAGTGITGWMFAYGYYVNF